MFKIKTYAIVILCIFISNLIASPKAFSQSTKNSIQNPTEYFNKRTEALSLVKNEKWEKAIPILESLTLQYPNDADLFYVLGLSYYETGQFKNAIIALKKTLESGGTILTDIPTGSAPSNDIMIKIAKAYAEDGDKENALLWLQKGFASRYDEKPFLKGDPAFKSFNEDEEFQQVFGYRSHLGLSRGESWVSDIDYLEEQILELHYNPFHSMSKTDFDKKILGLKSEIDSLSDEQIIVELMKIFGGLGNGHNLIIPTSPNKGTLKKLPVQFYQFNDGLFIVGAEKGFEKWIGHEVESIENTTAEDALQKTNAVNARDNDMQTLWLGPYYLGLPDVLKGLEIIENTDQVTITLKDSNEKSHKVLLNPVSWNFSGFPKMPKLKDREQPIFLSKIEDPYWFKLIPENKSIYVQFNAVTQKETQSLEAFTIELRSQASKNDIQHLILDLRHNHGGNGSILPPMLKTIINFELMHPRGNVFVLMGRETFSAAQNLLTDITKYTNAILVGEPSGSKPNHIGEAGWFKLPYSGLMGLISTQFHQTSKAEDNRKWIAPHIPVNISSTDYFNGNDTALDIVVEVIQTTESRK
ncbi:MAG: TPR end-of-group domain-containing protein [Allomuricauda sp.]